MYFGQNGRVTRQTIQLLAAAPAKPVAGALCNGCGACCAAAPCPVSRVWLRHRSGVCPALTWVGAEARYRCGMLLTPQRLLVRWPKWLAWLFRPLFRRWIGAGIGCDFDTVVE